MHAARARGGETQAYVRDSGEVGAELGLMVGTGAVEDEEEGGRSRLKMREQPVEVVGEGGEEA